MSQEDINIIKATDFIVLKNSADGTVDGVIAPNGLQVGLDDFTDRSLVVKTAVEIQSRTAPSNTDSKLYNIGGTLYFNGSEIGSGGGATASGSSGEFQFANASGDLDAAKVFWDSDKGKMFISGNLEVLGTETVIDTLHLHVEDPIIGLGTGSAGEGSAGDRGLIFLIGGVETNPSFYWDESANEFRLARLSNVPGDTTFAEPTAASGGGYQDFKLKTLHAVSGAVFDSEQRSLSTIGSDVFLYASGSNDKKVVFGGDVVISGSLSGGSPLVIDGTMAMSGSLFDISEYLRHVGDTDTFIRFQDDDINIQAGGIDFIKITEDGNQDKIILNEAGSDVDFRIESDNNESMFFVDGGINKVGIGTSGPHEVLDVRGNISVVGIVSASNGISGSLTRLVNGSSYIASGYDSLNTELVEKDPNRIDVYVNGQLMASGSSKDYILGEASTSLSFYFGLEVDDVITIRTY